MYQCFLHAENPFAFACLPILESKAIRKQSKVESIVFERYAPKQDE
jgi:hypothetical protein